MNERESYTLLFRKNQFINKKSLAFVAYKYNFNHMKYIVLLIMSHFWKLSTNYPRQPIVKFVLKLLFSFVDPFFLFDIKICRLLNCSDFCCEGQQLIPSLLLFFNSITAKASLEIEPPPVDACEGRASVSVRWPRHHGHSWRGHWPRREGMCLPSYRRGVGASPPPIPWSKFSSRQVWKLQFSKWNSFTVKLKLRFPSGY